MDVNIFILFIWSTSPWKFINNGWFYLVFTPQYMNSSLEGNSCSFSNFFSFFVYFFFFFSPVHPSFSLKNNVDRNLPSHFSHPISIFSLQFFSQSFIIPLKIVKKKIEKLTHLNYKRRVSKLITENVSDTMSVSKYIRSSNDSHFCKLTGTRTEG